MDNKDLIIETMAKQNADLTALVQSLTETIKELEETIRELQRQLNQNSQNIRSLLMPSSRSLPKMLIPLPIRLLTRNAMMIFSLPSKTQLCLMEASMTDVPCNSTHYDKRIEHSYLAGASAKRKENSFGYSSALVPGSFPSAKCFSR
jgi:hypothetical protein